MQKSRIVVCTILDGIKKCYVELTIYIVINVLNLSVLNYAEMSDMEILSLLSFEELKFVGLATKVISYLAFISIIIKGLFGHYHRNASVLFTRIAKAKWIKKRLVVGLLVLLALRLPLYIFLNWRLVCLVDVLSYLLVLLCTIASLVKNTKVSMLIFMVIFFFMFIKEINILFLLKMYILAFLLLLPSCQQLKKGR